MKHYIETIEQIINEDGTYSEYGKTTSVSADENTARASWHETCATVLKSIAKTSGKHHVYASIKLVNSLDGVLENAMLGSYVTEENTIPTEPTE